MFQTRTFLCCRRIIVKYIAKWIKCWALLSGTELNLSKSVVPLRRRCGIYGHVINAAHSKVEMLCP